MKKKKLKIAFISFFSGDVNRGVESLVYEIATRLSVHHEVDIYQRTVNKKKMAYRVISQNISMDWSKKDMSETVWRKLFLDYWSLKIGHHAFKILPMLIKGKYDVVMPLNGGWQSLLVRIATWLSHGKMVISGQSGIGWDDRINAWTFPNRIVAMSEFQIKWFRKVNPFVGVRKIPNGAYISKFKQITNPFDTMLQKPVVLVVAALIAWKRLDLTIKAIAKLNNTSLLLVGKGDQKEALLELGNKLLPGRFKISSFPYNEMPSIYASADLFTFPTDPSESFGIVLLEAMASGLAVVATDDPIRREIVGDAGIFVDPTNTDAYAAAIQEALKTKWGDKPKLQAAKFDWDKIAVKYEKLFLELVK